MFLKNLQHFYKVCKSAVDRFMDDGYTYRASALAFTTLLALVPLLLVIVFLLTVFPAFSQIILLGESYILQNFVPASAVEIEYYFHGFIQQATQLPAGNMLFLFLTTFLLVHTIEETLNEIWSVSRRQKGHKLLALFVYWLLFLLIPVIIGLSVLFSSYFFFFLWATTPENYMLAKFALNYLPLFINTMIFSMLYILVPNVKIRIREGILGGLLAAIFFEIARQGFAFYLAQFPSYALIYGAFAIIPIFLIWLYIFWCIILFSALIIHSQSKHIHHS